MLVDEASTMIVNFIHRSTFSAEIKLHVKQRLGLSEILGNFVTSTV